MPNLSDFTEQLNPNCFPLCSREQRKKNIKEGICSKVTSVFDDREVRCVAPWAREKIHYLTRYFDLFSTGMKFKWEGNINYIEICSGPGICMDRDSGTEFLGTPLAIAQKKSFDFLARAVFVDLNQFVVTTLNERFNDFGKSPKAIAIQGNYLNTAETIKDIRSHISKSGLNLIFIDPTDVSVPFETVASLSDAFGKSDIIINIMYGSDVKRGLSSAMADPYGRARIKYSSFLGSNDFFVSDINKALFEAGKHDQLHQKFIDCYLGKLKDIGYIYTGFQSVRHLYELFFATTNKKGLEFWEKATHKEPDGQRKLL
ncbi:MAG: three-Cys-motif partner protein TcmP [Bacteroidales bacterium]|jgi:three-Cys-motif partner protein